MRNAGDGVPYGGDLCDFAGVRWGSAGCAAERSMPVPYIGGCADSPGIFRNRWGVLRNAGDGVPYGGGCTDSPMAQWGSGGGCCGTARRPFPTDEFHTQSGC